MEAVVRSKKVKLPDFLIVGALKCGTTSLYHYLGQHPQIYMPAKKEPKFFGYLERQPQFKTSDYKGVKNIIWRFEDYVKLFQNAREGQLIGEATPSYLCKYDTAIPHIKSIYGKDYTKIKIIAILRNPVDRVLSQYLFLRKLGSEKLSLAKAINAQTIEKRKLKNPGFDYIDPGMYYKQVTEYLEEFHHVRICFFEDLKNSDRLVKNLFGFLGVDPNVEINTNAQFSISGVPRNKAMVKVILKVSDCFKTLFQNRYRLPLIYLRDAVLSKFLKKEKLDQATKETLLNIYRYDIDNLQKLTNRDLSHWSC